MPPRGEQRASLLSLCVQQNTPTLSPDPTTPAASTKLIAWTPAEVQHLLAHLLFPPPSSVPFLWAWSQFRRTHQYWAGYSHRRCRLKVQLA